MAIMRSIIPMTLLLRQLNRLLSCRKSFAKGRFGLICRSAAGRKLSLAPAGSTLPQSAPAQYAAAE